MSRTRKVVWSLLGAAVLLGAAAWVFQKPISVRVLEQVARKNVGRNIIPDLPDGLHLALCGTGSPFPDPTRAGPCSAIIAGDRLFIVDTGEGSARTLGYMGIPAAKIEAILLTHFHSDHIDGMGPFLLQRWGVGTAQTPTPVYGPTGVDRVVSGFRAAYALDFGYRVAHHTEKIMPPGGSGGKGMPFALPAVGQGDSVVVLDDKGLKITAFRVDHLPIEPAVGYRFDYKGRSVVISGDTKVAASLVAAAKDTDILVHEALQPNLVKILETQFADHQMNNMAQVMHDILNYHTTPEEAAQQATKAGARQLVLNHIVPPLPLRYAYPAFLGDAAKYYDKPITVGEDGMFFSLPAGSTAINTQRLY
ncbi:MBL fold metallo-hydrolase [Rhodoferax saidenbachensis]|uniref:MBL fold metallo-hydrolase n=1 Tax=Rhodoferax saidenbachensis TaxID=1484693 RepID=A0A1P8KAJ5_9BURK|nr:MBL fold metallo-hydrolase [Rhodoferax saidenbachensis]APW43027.1 MBL fold metallo-hydrolase [Rhodoferax saidenbachensis]